jgi:hypothetical protein
MAIRKAGDKLNKVQEQLLESMKMGGPEEPVYTSPVFDDVQDAPIVGPIKEEDKNTNPVTTPSPNNTNPYRQSSTASGIKTSGDLNPYLSASQSNPVTVTGNKNTTNVDNSVNQNTYDMSDNRRYYGGSNRTFNYKGGDGLSELYDSPVSKATMGGFYDVDDSPAAAASFLDRYIGMNQLYQKDVKKDYEKSGNFDYSRSTAAGVDYAAMYDNIQNTINRNKASSRAALDRIFGDKTALKNMDRDKPAEMEFSLETDDDDEE